MGSGLAVTQHRGVLGLPSPALMLRTGCTKPTHGTKRDSVWGAPSPPSSPFHLGHSAALSPSSTGSRKEPERIMPLDLSARERVLPSWDVLYSSKVESWVGMLLERVIRGAEAAVGLTARKGRVRVTLGSGLGWRSGAGSDPRAGMWRGSWDRGPKAGGTGGK